MIVSHFNLGDIFVYGGFPGHAVTVMAVAKNEAGIKVFHLSQGLYAGAVIFIFYKIIAIPDLSPWYDLSGLYPLYTPEWQFEKGSLKDGNHFRTFKGDCSSLPHLVGNSLK
jgi:hypothetical protein